MRPDRLQMRRLLVWSLCALCSPACSFLFVQRAPPEEVWPRLVWSSCTDSLAAPIVDGVVAASTVAGVADNNPNQGLTPLLVMAALTTGSAIWGWLQTSRCGELRAYMEQRFGLPPAWTTPQTVPDLPLDVSPSAPRLESP